MLDHSFHFIVIYSLEYDVAFAVIRDYMIGVDSMASSNSERSCIKMNNELQTEMKRGPSPYMIAGFLDASSAPEALPREFLFAHLFRPDILEEQQQK